MDDVDQLRRRLVRLETSEEIRQLAVRYALAVDGKDLDTFVSLYVPDVRVTGELSGREAFRPIVDAKFRRFQRSVHFISGHLIETDESGETARGTLYCRAEHEVGDRWVVMAMLYFDQYRRVGGRWLFESRRVKQWYSADILEHPQSVGFDSWGATDPPALPDGFATWATFWEAGNTHSGG